MTQIAAKHPLPVRTSLRTRLPSLQHPLGSQAKILLCSVFGPYAQDDDFGSRSINPMELWHNQVTRVQGPFSLRMFHRSWGLMLMQANIDARCTVLDFPTLDRFVKEITEQQYDIVGISGILPNFLKVETMCELVRKHQPNATIVIGGHIANLTGLEDKIDADHIVRGDGVRWLRHFVGEDVDKPIRHPQIWSGINTRTMGIDIPFQPKNTSATLIPSVGCPLGCNFCSTSAMFGGKGKHVEFFPEAAALFDVMCQLESQMKTQSFFVMDENFLLNRPRAMQLLDLMRKNNKAWALYVFSSANAIRQYTMDEIISLGVSWLWLGMEGKDSQYGKLKQTDTHSLVKELQDNGIRVLGSSIIGMEEHTPENIKAVIDHAVNHDVDFHQFMLYTPVAGTPLYEQHRTQGTLLDADECDYADTHGQFKFNFRHPHIRDGQETAYLLHAFEEDFRINGPSVLRVIRSTMNGWKKHRQHAEKRVRDRFAWEMEGICTIFAGALWAAKKWFKDNAQLAGRLDEQLREIRKEFGWRAKLAAPIIGRFILGKLKREAKRLHGGHTIEPPTFYERNFESANDATKATRIRWVETHQQQVDSHMPVVSAY